MASPTVSSAILILPVFIRQGRESRIVDGHYAKPNQFPYAVAIVKNGTRFGSGSIIHPSWALTAAHCIFEDVKNPQLLSLAASTIDVTSPGNVYTVEKLFVFPNFTFSKKLRESPYDLGLIKIRGQFKETPVYIGNVPLLSSQITAIGFGVTSFEDRNNTRLKFATLELVSLDALFVDQFKCSVVDGDVCLGDSGGPVISEDGYQFAVNTAVDDNCTGSTYVTQIAFHKDWLQKTIDKNN